MPVTKLKGGASFKNTVHGQDVTKPHIKTLKGAIGHRKLLFISSPEKVGTTSVEYTSHQPQVSVY